jgi:hypothetical protein
MWYISVEGMRVRGILSILPGKLAKKSNRNIVKVFSLTIGQILPIEMVGIRKLLLIG